MSFRFGSENTYVHHLGAFYVHLRFAELLHILEKKMFLDWKLISIDVKWFFINYKTFFCERSS